LKNSKLLALVLSTAISLVPSTAFAATATSTSNVTSNGNNKLIAFDEAQSAGEMLGQPVRNAVQEYFENVWYASLYPNVKQDIDNGYADPNYRHSEYVKVCRTIAENRDYLRNWGDRILEPWSNQLNLAVREENGVVNCYLRVLSKN
jgi:hypothetical protein